MRIGLRLFLAFFLIVGVAAFFVMRVFVDEVKPGVRQALEATLVDSANTLAELAADDLKAGRIADGRFAQRVAQAHARDPAARVWEFAKTSVDQEIVITDAQGVVVYASTGRDIGRDNSRWNDVYRTLRGESGARSTPRARSRSWISRAPFSPPKASPRSECSAMRQRSGRSSSTS